MVIMNTTLFDNILELYAGLFDQLVVDLNLFFFMVSILGANTSWLFILASMDALCASEVYVEYQMGDA